MKSVLLFIFSAFFIATGSLAQEDSLLQSLEVARSDSERVNIFNRLSQLSLHKDPEQSKEYAINALEIANRIDFDKGFADAAVNLGDVGRAKNLPDAHQYYEHAIDIYLSEGYELEAAKASIKAGVLFLIKGDYLNAEVNYWKAFEIFEKHQDSISMAGTLHNLGNVNFLRGKFGVTLDFYFRALELRTQLKDQKGISGTLINIGNVYNQQDRLEKALEYYNKALQLKESIGDSKGLVTCYNNIGSVLSKQSDNERALKYFRRAITMSDSLNLPGPKSEAMTNIGQIYSEEGNYSRALEYFFKALDIAKKSDNPYGQSHILTNLGKINSKMGNHPQAIGYLKKASEIAHSISAREEIKMVEQALSEAYERSGDFQKALVHYKNYVQYKDTLFNREIATKTSELELKYNQAESEKEIEILRKENQVQELTLYKNKILTISSLAVSALIIGFLVLLMTSYRKNQKKNYTLSLQNKDILRQKEEKEVLLKEVHHRVKNNLQIINSLLRLQSNYISDQEVLNYFQECQNRVHAMALIHEKLYESHNLSQVSILSYVQTLVENLVRSYGLTTPVKTKVTASDIVFPVNTLIPIALILNETVSNSLKYAFAGKEKGEIRVDIEKKPGQVQLTICDDGIGYPDSLWQETPTLGLELVKTFVEQLEGTINKSGGEGTRYEIFFPLDA